MASVPFFFALKFSPENRREWAAHTISLKMSKNLNLLHKYDKVSANSLFSIYYSNDVI